MKNPHVVHLITLRKKKIFWLFPMHGFLTDPFFFKGKSLNILYVTTVMRLHVVAKLQER